MLALLISVILVLLVVGVLLWAVSALPFLDGNIKQLIRILVIVIAALWVIGLLAGMIQAPHFGVFR